MFDRIQPIRHSTFPIYTSMKYSVFDNIGLHTLPFQANTPPSVACQCSVNLNQSKNLCVLFSSIFVSYLFTQEMEWRTQNLLQNVPEKNKKNKTYIKFIDTCYCVVCSKKNGKLTTQTDRDRKTNNNNKPYCEGFFPQTPSWFTLEHRQQKEKPTMHTHCPHFEINSNSLRTG